MEMTIETVNSIRAYADEIVAQEGYQEDVDFEDAFELAELVAGGHPHVFYTYAELFHGILCGMDECLCEDAE